MDLVFSLACYLVCHLSRHTEKCALQVSSTITIYVLAHAFIGSSEYNNVKCLNQILLC